MKYALGNMLNGAGGLNADQLALDLQFAADKTLTARKGPTPVLTRGSSATFVGSNGLIQTAAVDAARFDHDPVTLASRGLLIEEGRTNNVQRSEEFSDAYWSKSRVTVTANATTSPDGATTADKMVETATAGDHNTNRTNISLSPQQTVTYSVFVKAAERFEIQLRIQEGVNGLDCSFNLNSLSITATQFGTGSGSTGSIVAYPNGWYRCILTGRPSASTGTAVNVVKFMAVSGNVNYTGDGTSGIFIWGAQLEAGAFPTSYIPTTTSALARSADVCSITGAAFNQFYNQTQGTAVIKTIGGDATSSRELFKFGSSSNVLYISGYSRFLATEVAIVTNNIQQFIYFGSLTRSNEKLSLAYAQNNAAYCRNGAITATDNSIITSSLINRLDLGFGGINGCISSFSYYKKRLPNAKLQALTA